MSKLYIICILFFLINPDAHSQKQVFDSNDSLLRNVNFSFADDMEKWGFGFEANKPWKWDSSLGRIMFFRLRDWDDNPQAEFKTPGQGYLNITYYIYPLKDSGLVKRFSKTLREMKSLCNIPYRGGEYFVAGNFIFINSKDCLNCYRNKTGTDYCRPMVNRIFSNMNGIENATLKEIIEKIPLKKQKIKIPINS